MIKKPTFKTGMIIATATCITLYALAFGMILKVANSTAADARAEYAGDHVDALIALVDDAAAPFAKRNSAIWALGYIGDERALPSLRSLQTGEEQPTPHETENQIAQDYITKAIKQIERPSMTRWIYRFF